MKRARRDSKLNKVDNIYNQLQSDINGFLGAKELLDYSIVKCTEEDYASLEKLEERLNQASLEFASDARFVSLRIMLVSKALQVCLDLKKYSDATRYVHSLPEYVDMLNNTLDATMLNCLAKSYLNFVTLGMLVDADNAELLKNCSIGFGYLITFQNVTKSQDWNSAIPRVQYLSLFARLHAKLASWDEMYENIKAFCDAYELRSMNQYVDIDGALIKDVISLIASPKIIDLKVQKIEALDQLLLHIGKKARLLSTNSYFTALEIAVQLKKLEFGLRHNVFQVDMLRSMGVVFDSLPNTNAIVPVMDLLAPAMEHLYKFDGPLNNMILQFIERVLLKVEAVYKGCKADERNIHYLELGVALTRHLVEQSGYNDVSYLIDSARRVIDCWSKMHHSRVALLSNELNLLDAKVKFYNGQFSEALYILKSTREWFLNQASNVNLDKRYVTNMIAIEDLRIFCYKELGNIMLHNTALEERVGVLRRMRDLHFSDCCVRLSLSNALQDLSIIATSEELIREWIENSAYIYDNVELPAVRRLALISQFTAIMSMCVLLNNAERGQDYIQFVQVNSRFVHALLCSFSEIQHSFTFLGNVGFRTQQQLIESIHSFIKGYYNICKKHNKLNEFAKIFLTEGWAESEFGSYIYNLILSDLKDTQWPDGSVERFIANLSELTICAETADKPDLDPTVLQMLQSVVAKSNKIFSINFRGFKNLGLELLKFGLRGPSVAVITEDGKEVFNAFEAPFTPPIFYDGMDAEHYVRGCVTHNHNPHSAFLYAMKTFGIGKLFEIRTFLESASNAKYSMLNRSDVRYKSFVAELFNESMVFSFQLCAEYSSNSELQFVPKEVWSIIAQYCGDYKAISQVTAVAFPSRDLVFSSDNRFAFQSYTQETELSSFLADRKNAEDYIASKKSGAGEMITTVRDAATLARDISLKYPTLVYAQSDYLLEILKVEHRYRRIDLDRAHAITLRARALVQDYMQLNPTNEILRIFKLVLDAKVDWYSIYRSKLCTEQNLKNFLSGLQQFSGMKSLVIENEFANSQFQTVYKALVLYIQSDKICIAPSLFPKTPISTVASDVLKGSSLAGQLNTIPLLLRLMRYSFLSAKSTKLDMSGILEVSDRCLSILEPVKTKDEAKSSYTHAALIRSCIELLRTEDNDSDRFFNLYLDSKNGMNGHGYRELLDIYNNVFEHCGAAKISNLDLRYNDAIEMCKKLMKCFPKDTKVKALCTKTLETFNALYISQGRPEDALMCLMKPIFVYSSNLASYTSKILEQGVALLSNATIKDKLYELLLSKTMLQYNAHSNEEMTNKVNDLVSDLVHHKKSNILRIETQFPYHSELCDKYSRYFGTINAQDLFVSILNTRVINFGATTAQTLLTKIELEEFARQIMYYVVGVFPMRDSYGYIIRRSYQDAYMMLALLPEISAVVRIDISQMERIVSLVHRAYSAYDTMALYVKHNKIEYLFHSLDMNVMERIFYFMDEADKMKFAEI